MRPCCLAWLGKPVLLLRASKERLRRGTLTGSVHLHTVTRQTGTPWMQRQTSMRMSTAQVQSIKLENQGGTAGGAPATALKPGTWSVHSLVPRVSSEHALLTCLQQMNNANK